MRLKLNILLFSVLAFLLSYWGGISYLGTILETPAYYLASLVFEKKVAPEELLQKYKNGEIKILIVPGHDKESYGAQYRGVTEASLNAELGGYLFEFLRNEPKFTIFITRKSTGETNEWFSDYIESQKTSIAFFKETVKNAFKEVVSSGNFIKQNKIFHNPAADNTSQALYGVNKWANDNNIDIVLHLHLNDYPGRKYDMPGKYKGFSIYVPDRQFPNGEVSIELAKSIKNELAKITSGSNFPKEKEVVIEDQQLIAVGSNASRKGASILLEYGYIYEPQFIDKEIRHIALREMAEATYLGLKNFFGN